jgi:glycosyltransferase involved in cell wall biosynthesis
MGSMKVLFQNIGVLVQYNWALPFYMLKEKADLTIVSSCSLFSYQMGGFYYHLKVADRMSILFSGIGIGRLDNTLEKISASFIRSKDFDTLHLNSNKSPLAKKMLCERTAKVFTFHGSLDKCKDRNQYELEDVYSKVDFFVAVSNHSAKTIREVCGFDPLVIHNGVDTSVFNPRLSEIDARKRLGLPLNKKIILWNGRISPEKRLDVLIRAIPRIIKDDKNVFFLIKGRTVNNEYVTLIRRLIKKMDMEKYIKLSLGWTPNIHLNSYYRASDAYVHSSITEGFSLTLLEAMASGIAVIGNDASSIPEAIGDSGLLYNNSSEDLAENVLKLLCNDDLVRKLGERAFQRIMEKFTLSSTAKKYLHLYNEIS